MNYLVKGLSASAIALSAMVSTATAADRVLTVSHWAGPNHAMATTVFPWMNDELSACSGGSLTLKIENGLAPPPAQYDTIRDGVADIGWIVHGYTPGKFKTTKMIELPGTSGNAEQMSVAFQSTHEKYLAAVGEAKGVQVLTNFVHGPGNINSVKELSSLADMNGMKMRVGGGVANNVGTALGVAGVNVPAPAVYETIASGVADGVFFPMETLFSFKISELVKHVYTNPDGIYTTSFAIIMNDDVYDELDDAQQACVDGMRGVEMARSVGAFWDEADRVGLEQVIAAGVEVHELSADQRAFFKDATSGIEADVLAEVDSRGINGQEALDYMRSMLP
ncbi:TRAP dicarboxylate transporter, DctP subunit [Rhodobacteraceae bacterium HTCC2150]|nr:TRAP dicarboxylate transporter, DctP subunit [Rhodobacteraceae bacterium HTCC2150]